MLIACVQLYFTLLNLQANYQRKQMKILRMLFVQGSGQEEGVHGGILKFVPEEVKENFTMSPRPHVSGYILKRRFLFLLYSKKSELHLPVRKNTLKRFENASLVDRACVCMHSVHFQVMVLENLHFCLSTLNEKSAF